MCQYLADDTGNTGGTSINHPIVTDDLMPMSEISSELQWLIHKLEIYCDRWHMGHNIFKTKIMIIIEGSQICREQVSLYKYLRVISLIFSKSL